MYSTEVPNINFLKEQALDNEDMIKTILEVIKKEFPSDIKTYHMHIKENNYDQSAECVHKFKHKLSLFGLKDAISIANQHELNLYNNDRSMVDIFEEIITKVSAFLKTI